MEKEQLLTLAEKLVAIRSTNSNPHGLQEAIDTVADIIRAHQNITIEEFSQNGKPSFLAFAGPRRPKHFKVLLNAHVDVVPGKDSLFKLHRDEDILLGRGALDMKLATIVLADTFARVAPKLPYALGLQVVSDEEIGGHDGTYHQKDSGVASEFVIVGESTNLDICSESKGFCRLQITVRGKSAHSAYLWRGQNAIIRLMQVLEQVLAIYPVPSRESWITTVNIANIHTTNAAINIVPDAATAELDIRFIEGDKNFVNKKAIASFFAKFDPAIEVTFITGIESPIAVDAKNPFVTQLANTISEIQHSPPSLIRKHGSSDARFYPSQAIAFGPAGQGIHAGNEQVTISSLLQYQKIVERFLLNIA